MVIKTFNGESLPVDANGLVWLSTVTAANSATVDVETTFNSTYDAYLLIGSGITIGTNFDTILCRFKLSGSYVASAYSLHANISTSGSNAYSGTVTGGTSLQLAPATSSAAAACTNLHMRICNPASTALSKHIDWTGETVTAASTITYASGIGLNTGTGALTGIRIFASTGNILAGTFRLYGIANS